MLDWLTGLLDAEKLQHLIEGYGLLVMAPVVFAETGLLVGFFLPGDSLLFLAGAVAALSEGRLDPLLVAGVLTVAAILGNTVNYGLGRCFGGWAAGRPDGRILKRRYFEEAHAFYERWGALSLVLTRYIPILRTFVPFSAGAARMGFARYSLWNVVGALTWVPVLVGLGWFLGEVPFVKRHIETILLAVIVLSVAPVAVAAGLRWWKGRKAAAASGVGG
ncbi:MAG: hypothetical protein RLZZ127_1274 [Planctomycetota bacterium]|jgi:membrane-associated protein